MKLFTTIFLFAFSVCLQAQTYFNNRYTYDGSSSLDFCDVILKVEDGYLVPGGYLNEENYTLNSLGILHIDSFGIVQQVKVYGDSIYSYNFAYTQGGFRQVDSDFYSVGVIREYTGNWVHDLGTIYKFNNNLDTLWTKTIGDKQYPYDTNYLFRHFDVLQNNELIIAGQIIVDGSESKTLLIKTDSLGNELWRKYFANGDKNLGINVIQTPDGGFAVSCYLWTFGTHQIAAPYIVKTDSFGNEQWRHYIEWNDQKHGAMYLQNADNNTIIGAYSYSDSVAYPSSDSFNRDALIKLDLQGNIIWDKKYGESKRKYRYLNSIEINDEDKLIISGKLLSTIYPHEGYNGYMSCFTQDGDSIWFREYSFSDNLYTRNSLYGAIPTNDGGFIAVGDILPFPPDTGNQDVWVIKVDSLGCINFDECWTNINELISNISDDIKIYPNPSSQFINISIPNESKNKNVFLSIHDLFGRNIKNIKLESDSDILKVNISDWKIGLYTIIIYDQNKISYRGKFIKR